VVSSRKNQVKTPWSTRISQCEQQFASKRNGRIRKEIVALMDNPRSVLEVGAGSQELKKRLDCDYVSCDLEPRFEPDVVGDGHNLPFKDNAFDVVVTKNCLQHLPSYERVVSEIIRVASERVVLAERVWDKPTQIVSKTPVLRRRFNRADLIGALKEWGEVSFKLSEADNRVGLYLGEPY